MNATALSFPLEDTRIGRPRRTVAHPVVEASEDSVTGVAGIVLWGELLDRLGLVDEADRRRLRPIGPGGYTGGECYRAVVECQLAGGDFLADRSLLADEATQRLRGAHALPSHTTLWRFCAGADLGRASIAAAVNRAMLRRAWAMGPGRRRACSPSTPTPPGSPPMERTRRAPRSPTPTRSACRPWWASAGRRATCWACGPGAATPTPDGPWAASSTSAWAPSPPRAGPTTSCGSGSTRPATGRTWSRRPSATTRCSASRCATTSG